MKSKMIKVIAMLVLSGIFSGMLMGVSLFQQENVRIKGDQAGYMLLDSVVVTFARLSKEGRGDAEPIERALDNWMAQARRAMQGNRIDAVFFKRFRRLLVVIKLSIVSDPAQHLAPIILEEINAFDIPREYRGKIAGLGSVADLLAAEILSLKRYLDAGKKKVPAGRQKE